LSGDAGNIAGMPYVKTGLIIIKKTLSCVFISVKFAEYMFLCAGDCTPEGI
jgi:hypothetical protein